MKVNFSNIDFSERPTLILKNASDTPLGVLGYAKNIELDMKYNETSSIEFEVPEFVDGVETPLYREICGMRTLELMGIAQFTLISPTESGDGIRRTKSCKGYSLEYEFVYKKMSLPKGTYKFWDEQHPNDTLLGMIMERMPSWSMGEVSMSLQNKYRTIEVNNENLYNLIKGTLQQSFNCIFDFDTISRRVYVRDAAETPSEKPVFISLDNLAKEIEVKENTEDIVTRLDVSGAEGVNIRDVNPTGSNKIINLDYYMTETNFPAELISKYNAWKQCCEDNRRPYYNLSVQYALMTAQKIAETAKLTDLQNEKTSLENLQAVAIQGIARGLATQDDLDEANAAIAEKQAQIEAKESEIANLHNELTDTFSQLQAITEACNFESAFTDEEYRLLDRYIKDGEIQESGFVASEVQDYNNVGNGKSMSVIGVTFTDGSVEHIETAAGGDIYDIKGGTLEIENDMSANVISAVVERRPDSSFVATAHLSSGTIAGNSFPSACVTLTGESGSITVGSGTASVTLNDCYRYFTLDASEYEKRSVAWELYEYGEDALNRLCSPSYSFSVTSANFLALDEFITFRDALTLGEKVYIDLGAQGVLSPILTCVKFSYDDIPNMALEFGDTFYSGDSTFRLVDLLEQSISMGKNVEMSKYIYSAFIDSGASTGLRDFMTSALDVSKNAIISSNDMAISWDGAGFRLRQWSNTAHTAYDPEQMWIINNSIVMTDDNWETAKMAIGKFHDDNLGDCWGIVAPRIVGTLLAGSALVIESAKRDGGVALFRMDGDGCRLFNSDISVSNDAAQIVLNPEIGFAIGSYPLYDVNENTGVKTLNEDNAKFWADANGNLHIKGTLHGVDGDFEGSVRATSLTIEGEPCGQFIDNRITIAVQPIGATANSAKTLAEQGKELAEKIYNGEDGIYFTSSDVDSLTLNRTVGLKIVGTDDSYFQVKNGAMGFFKDDGDAMLYYENGNMILRGSIIATAGQIGGWNIAPNEISIGSFVNGTQMGLRANDPDWGIWAGSGKFLVKPNGYLYAENAEIRGKVTATSGTIGGFTVTGGSLYCGGARGSSPTSVGLSTDPSYAFWAGNGIFRVSQSGYLYASNAEITGKLIAGNWTFDSYGSVYEDGSVEVRMDVSGGWARYSTHNLSAEYGSTSYHSTRIYGGEVRMHCAELGESVSIRDGHWGSYNYNDVCVVCDQAGGTWDGAHGNMGTTDQRWDVGWFRVMHYNSLSSGSSRTIKHDIEDMPDMGSTIDLLNPVVYRYNDCQDERLRHGLIYEDTVEVLPDICLAEDEGGKPSYAIEYMELVTILLKEIQGLRKRVAALEAA